MFFWGVVVKIVEFFFLWVCGILDIFVCDFCKVDMCYDYIKILGFFFDLYKLGIVFKRGNKREIMKEWFFINVLYR